MRLPVPLRIVTVIVVAIATCVSCARQTGLSGIPGLPFPKPVPLVPFEHVFLVVKENQNYEEVIGNNKDMPYLNQLAARYGMATNYYANTHPSINNYFYLTAGRSGTRKPWGGDLADKFPGEVAGDNVASILTANGKKWRAYAESIPRDGYVDGDHFPYVKRHNPFAYFETVRKTDLASLRPPQTANIVSFDNFARDLQHDSLPDYSFIVPNLYNDGHNDAVTRKGASCGDHRALQQVDSWLKDNMEPLIQSATFKRAGLLVIVFDEGCELGPKADWRYDPKKSKLKGGGHIPALIISSRTPAGTKIDELYHHESVLRLSLRALGVEQLPGMAKRAPDMDGFFSTKTK
jgi:phosphatidylinositol-3-phosphatase